MITEIKKIEARSFDSEDGMTYAGAEDVKLSDGTRLKPIMVVLTLEDGREIELIVAGGQDVDRAAPIRAEIFGAAISQWRFSGKDSAIVSLAD